LFFGKREIRERLSFARRENRSLSEGYAQGVYDHLRILIDTMTLIRGGYFAAFLLLNSILLASASAQTGVTIEVGAWADDASRNNLGVQVEIETHAYDTYSNTLDYFWVGDNLANGAFIQFGYSLEPGVYCLQGAFVGGNFKCLGASEIIPSSDPRWQWQYWPNRGGSDHYYQIGPQGSAGTNGTWHAYMIRPDSSNSWDFLIDGHIVAYSNFTVNPSVDPAFVVAERTEASSTPIELGPIRFRHISYLNFTGWQGTDSLIALSYCQPSGGCATPFGVSATDNANSLIVGSGVTKSHEGALLWTSGYVKLNVDVHESTPFLVTSPLGMQGFTGNASIDIPKGMFAYVSLLDTVTGTSGTLGLIGAKDRFRGWTGAANSRNLTVQILMSSNRNMKAEWNTDLSVTIVLLTGVAVIALGLVVGLVKKRNKSVKLRS
jgi:hypothetical protein